MAKSPPDRTNPGKSGPSYPGVRNFSKRSCPGYRGRGKSKAKNVYPELGNRTSRKRAGGGGATSRGVPEGGGGDGNS